MDLTTFIKIHEALGGTSSGIFAILLGFTLFMLNAGGKKVELSTAILLGLGIFGSLIATAVSTISIIFGYWSKVVNVPTIYLSCFCLFTSITALGILTFLALSQLYSEQVKEERHSSWDFMRLK